jgi:ribosomal protein S18 acetylase RimI-like enzyme
MKVVVNNNPNRDETYRFMEMANDEIDPIDADKFAPEDNQTKLEQWLDVDELFSSLGKYCSLIEARNDDGRLIGVAVLGKQNLVTWPDGKKVEIFTIASDPTQRRSGIASQLLLSCELEGARMGAEAVVVNTHIFLSSAQRFYEKNGFFNAGVLKGFYANGDAVCYIKKLM